MELLYVAPVPIDMKKLDGVAKKVMTHVKVFSEHFQVKLLYRYNDTIMLYDAQQKESVPLGKGKSKIQILEAAKDLILKLHFDFAYIRYPNSDIFFLSLLKTMKKRELRVVVEIPTYPYDKEGKDTIKGRVISVIDRIYRRKLYKYVNRIVTYSIDNKIFNIPTIKTINGIDFEAISLIKLKGQETVHFCAVSGMYKLHGYDRLILGIYNYYLNGGTRDIIFDIVGEGVMSEEYQELVKKYELQNRVIFHGKLFGDALNAVYEKASIGVNSLAIHRQNLVRESTLKTREYVAKGLPILSSSYVDAFDIQGNEKYVFISPADDTPIDISKLLAFYDNLLHNYSLEELRREIRKEAECICDMRVTQKVIVDYYKGLDNE